MRSKSVVREELETLLFQAYERDEKCVFMPDRKFNEARALGMFKEKEVFLGRTFIFRKMNFLPNSARRD